MIKIAVSGKLGSGKDLFLYYAQANFPQLQFVNDKFAGPIYEAVDYIQLYLNQPRVKDGALLQFIGNHYRKIDQDFWVKMYFNYESQNNTIVTDVRFPNELKGCKDHGYTTVRIVRKEELRMENLGNRDNRHISETALDDTPNVEFDYVINNNGSLDLYEGAVISIIDEVLRKKQVAA